MILAKFLKNILHLLTGLRFDIFYVIKTGSGFETAEITRLLNYFRGYSFAPYLFLVIYLKILENSQEYVYSEVIYL